MVSALLMIKDDSEYASYAIWNRAYGPSAWSFWLDAIPVIVALVFLHPGAVGSWQWGMVVAVLASCIPLLAIAIKNVLDPQQGGFWSTRYDMNIYTVLREITLVLTLLLLAARRIWPLPQSRG